MVGGMVQYSRNSFTFTKLIIHIQQIVFILKNENILIQQNSYSHSANIFFMHIQQKSYHIKLKSTFTLSTFKNCCQQIPEAVAHLSKRFYKMADSLREEIWTCVREELQRIERTPNQTSNANLVQGTPSLIEASPT